MQVTRCNRKAEHPAVLIAGCFYRICEYLFVFAFVKPSALRVCSTALFFLDVASPGSVFVAVVIAVFLFAQRFFSVFRTVSFYLFAELPGVKLCFFFNYLFRVFLVVGTGFYMSGIHKYFTLIHEAIPAAFLKYMREYLLEKIRPFEPSRVVLSKCCKMRHVVRQVQPKKPSVCHIDFNISDRLSHTAYPIQILYYRDLDQCDRIDARPSRFVTVPVFNNIVNKTPIDRFLDLAKQMILRYKIIYADNLHLLPFLCPFSYHCSCSLTYCLIIPFFIDPIKKKRQNPRDACGLCLQSEHPE